MMTRQAMEKMMAQLALLPFFPASPQDRLVLSEYVENFAETDDQLKWLGARMLDLYKEWPGPREMRACFCSRYRPKDGISITSAVYAAEDGIPSERQPERLLLPAARALPPGEPTADPEFAAKLHELATAMSLNTNPRHRQSFVRKIAAENAPPQSAPLSPAEGQPLGGRGGRGADVGRITEDDIARALAANRERRARGVQEFWKDEEKP